MTQAVAPIAKPETDKRREDVFVSLAVTDLDASPASFSDIVAMSHQVAQTYRYWELLIVVEAARATEFQELMRQVENIRMVKLRSGVQTYQIRVIAASEAIGDIVLVASAPEIHAIDAVAMIERARRLDIVVICTREGTHPLNPLIMALGNISGFRATTRDMATAAYPRTLINRLLALPDRQLAMRFIPRDSALPVSYMPATFNRSRAIFKGMGPRLGLIQRLLTNAAPRVLNVTSLLAALTAIVALFFAAYAVAVWLLMDEVQPGWFTTSLAISLTACFLGIAIFGLSTGLLKIIDIISPEPVQDVVGEEVSADLFSQVMTQLNVETDPGEAPGPADQIECRLCRTLVSGFSAMAADIVDYLVIGGGFYGCCLGLFLRSVSPHVAIVEADDQIMQRASRVNQARVHTGFHYPRSVLTAVKSRMLHRRFAEDFPDAVKTDFQMLYAIARRHSKVSAARFERMFTDMQAPIRPVLPSQRALFSPELVEDVFACTEYAFDYSRLRQALIARMDLCSMPLYLNSEVVNISETGDAVVVTLRSGRELRTRYLFNVTYGQINHVLQRADLPQAPLKFELTELALGEPPDSLQGLALTVMDGPFFSVMPYPAEDLYSLTHVRYTPHLSWRDKESNLSPYEVARHYHGQSRSRYMIQDARRFVPSLAGMKIKTSLFDIKAILMKNEKDDGRPILFQRRPETSRVLSVLGGKIDNIYDLFDLVRTIEPALAEADDRYLFDKAHVVK